MSVTATPSSFVDNPLVGAIGNALGMGGLLASTASSSAGELKPPPVPPSETERVRDSRNVRQTYPKASTRGSQPGVGVNGPGMNMPGVMSPDVLMHPAVQELLGKYGVTPDQLQSTAANASPNLFVTNPAAYAKHPMLAGMAERALEGLAFTQGSRTWGEGLSNVAQGMLNARAARADKYNNMLMMPFMQAQQVAGMKNIETEEQLKQAQMEYDRAHASYFDMLPELRQQMLDQTAQYHKGMIDVRKMALNQRMMVDPRLGYLTSEQSDALQNEMKDDEFSTDRFEHYAQMGQANHDKQIADLKERLAKISGGFRVAVSKAGADKTLEAISARGDVQDAMNNEKSAQKALDDFNKDIARGYANGPDGKMIISGDAASVASARQAYQKGIDTAHSQTQNLLTGLMNASSAPDARNVSKSASNVLTYNPVTGKIE